MYELDQQTHIQHTLVLVITKVLMQTAIYYVNLATGKMVRLTR